MDAFPCHSRAITRGPLRCNPAQRYMGEGHGGVLAKIANPRPMPHRPSRRAASNQEKPSARLPRNRVPRPRADNWSEEEQRVLDVFVDRSAIPPGRSGPWGQSRPQRPARACDARRRRSRRRGEGDRTQETSLFHEDATLLLSESNVRKSMLVLFETRPVRLVGRQALERD